MAGSLILGVVLVTLCLLIWRWAWAPDLPAEQLALRWAQPPSFFVEQAGMKVHVRVEGPTDDPVPIVLLHGTGSNLYTWDGWVKLLSQHRKVIRFDRPGFGLTGPDPSNDYSMARATELTLDLLDRLNVKKFIVAGNSSGGRVAWHVALQHPARVAGIILVAAAGYPRTTPLPSGLRFAQSSLGSFALSYLMPQSMVIAGLKAAYGDPLRLRPETIEQNAQIARRAGVRRIMGETIRQAAIPDDSHLIPNITVPALVLWGDRDNTVTRAEAESFHRDMRNSELQIIPGLGHLAHEEDPINTLAPVLRFLSARTPDPGEIPLYKSLLPTQQTPSRVAAGFGDSG